MFDVISVLNHRIGRRFSMYLKKKYLTGIIWGIFFIVYPLHVNAEEGLSVDNLRINQLAEPFGIPEDSVKCSWSIQSDQKSTQQTEYHIVMAKTEDALQKEQYVCDTGWIAFDENSNVLLNAELEENQLYYWQVQVKDNYGRTSELSSAQAFSTEVGSEWEGTQGIWDGTDDYVFFRWQQYIKADEVEKVLVSATAASPEKSRQYVYNLYVNGNNVGSGPSRIDNNTLYYNTYDVTGLLKNGQNVVGAICYSESGHAFLGQITVYYKDGTKKVLSNTGNDKDAWKALRVDSAFGNGSASVGTGNYYTQAAENMNSKNYPHGWLEENYSVSSWDIPILSKGCDDYQLEPYSSENMMRYNVIPKSVKKLSEGNYLVDFGKEIVGSLGLEIDSESEQSIQVYYGEELDSDGNVRYEMGTGNNYSESWTLTQGKQKLETVNMKTFRYVQSKGRVEITEENVTGLQIRQAFSEDASDFSSANSVLNDEYDLAKYTIKTTNQDMYVDTQSRERQNYSGDLLINMMTSFSMEADYTLAAHSLDYALNHPTWPAEYLLYSVQAAWQYYLYSGDIDFLNEHYELLKESVSQFSVDSTGLVKEPEKSILVDWPKAERDGYKMSDSYYNTVLNAIYSGTCGDMRHIAETLGNTSDAEVYQNLSDTVKSNMISKLYNADTGRYADGMNASEERVDHYSQHATVFALAFGIYDSQNMADLLVDSIREDGLNQTSVYATYFMLQGLYRSNQGMLARQIMSDPSNYEGSHTWANMMYRVGATLTAEAWDNSIKSNMSYSHPWGTAPGCWLVKGLFGISPRSGAYRTFDVKLQPGGVEQATVKVPTLNGNIDASYQLNGNGMISLQITIPSNSEARILIPIEEDTGVLTVDGMTVDGEKVENQYLSVTVESGSHTIVGGSGNYANTTELKQNENVVYQTYGSLWNSYETNGNTSGSTGESQAIYGFRALLNSKEDGGIRYSTYRKEDEWTEWNENGQIDKDENEMIQAVKIELTGAVAWKKDIYYRIYSQTFGWLDWAKNGEAAGTIDMNKRAEAIEIVLVEKGSEAPGDTEIPLRQAGEINYSVHSQTYGWMNPVSDGATAGTVGEKKRLEAIKIEIDPSKIPYSGSVQYQVHSQSYGWMDWVSDGEEAGTSGQSKRLEAIKIKLTDELEEKYDIYYRVHAQAYGWLDWAKNGESAGTSGQSKRLEAIQIVLIKKGEDSPGNTERPFVGKLSYTTHVQSYGWQDRVYDGEMSGTNGQSKRLEGIRIKLEDLELSGGVKYCTHVQSYGWQDWVSDDQISGTTGEAKRLEAIRIELTGKVAQQYNIYYRVHCQTYGWLGWAKNGEVAGTSGMGKRLEAIEIKILPEAAEFDTGGPSYYMIEETENSSTVETGENTAESELNSDVVNDYNKEEIYKEE